MAELFSRMNAPDFDEISLQLTDLEMSRGGTSLFAGLSTSVTNGDVLWIQGDNGIGKTTLLGALAGLNTIDNGKILWAQNKTPCDPGHIAAYQPHQSYAKASLTAREDLKFWSGFFQTRISVNEALSAVGLSTKSNVRTGRLSAGQKRRLALAKLIVSEKPLWLLDEPAAAMDQDGIELIDKLLKHHITRGGAAIMASHGAARPLSQATRILTLRAMT